MTSLRACVVGGVLVLAASPAAAAEVTCFTHFEIGVLPGTQWGTAGPAVGDFDGDGDLDFAVARRETATLYWYETRPRAPGLASELDLADPRFRIEHAHDVGPAGRVLYAKAGVIASAPRLHLFPCLRSHRYIASTSACR